MSENLIITKICSRCKQEKNIELFHVERQNKDGRCYYCKDCANEIKRKWYQDNIEHARLQNNERCKTPEYVEYHRNYQRKHKAILRERDKKPRYRYSHAKANAKYRKIVWNLDFETYANLISQSCFYCGYPLQEFGTGLDRIDSNKEIGYIASNVVPCCTQCNEMKNEFSLEEFKNKILQISKHLGLI